jgi:hypothetical protein
MMSKHELVRELHDFDMVISFNLGSVSSSVLCTLDEDIVPKTNEDTINGDFINVFNLESEKWDSIPYSSIVEAKHAIFA